MKLGAIEAGGTKFVCAVGDEQFNVIERTAFPTKTPAETLAETVAFFKEHPVDAIGIGSFGPIDINPDSATYGYVTKTPKPGWQNADFLGYIQRELDVPTAWTTDVNEAAYGEAVAGATRGDDTSIYVTIGTGIGAGVVSHGGFYAGRTHTELGHLVMNRLPGDDLVSVCPFHDNCAEGLASGPAVNKRAGKPAVELAEDDPIWQTEASYIAQICVDLTVAFAPDKIILNGGVMHQQQLMPMVRDDFQTMFNNYQDLPAMTDYIVPAQLKDNSGIVGGFALAKDAL